MFATMKRIGILVVLMVMVFSCRSFAQTIVLNKFQLGKSTYEQVKANLPKEVKIEQNHSNPSAFLGGPWFSTDGKGYGITGLRKVTFGFDIKQTLVHVQMTLEGQRLNDINKILASKYHRVRSYPGVRLLFKANCDYVYLYFPRDKDFVVEYMTGAIYRLEQSTVRQTAEERKADEREEQKRIEREAAEEAAKF
jgi:hypothetical protein